MHGKRTGVLCVLAAALLSAALLATVGSAAPKKESALSGTLSLYVVQGMPFQRMIEDFQNKHPGVRISLAFGPPGPGYGQGLVTLIQAGNAPDIFYVNPGTSAVQGVGLLGPAGRLVNLYDQPWVKRLKGAARGLWVQQSKNGKTGTVWAYPFTVQGVGLVWNDGEFQKLGLKPPKTWGQLLTLCGRIKAAGKEPMLISGLAPAMPTMNRAIANVYAKDPNWNAKRAAGKVTFAGTPGWVKTLNDMKTLADRCFAPNWSGLSVPQVFSEMAAGRALMAQLPTGAAGTIVGLNSSLSIKAQPFPADTVKGTVAQAFWADALAISSSSKNPAVAKAFLNFLSDPNRQAAYAKTAFTVAPVQAAVGKPIPEFMSAFGPYFKSGKVMQRPYDVWCQPGPLLALQTFTTAFLLGRMTAAETLAAFDKSWCQATAQS